MNKQIEIPNTKLIEKLLKQSVFEGVIICQNCGSNLEPDNPKCQCGWINPLVKFGYI